MMTHASQTFRYWKFYASTVASFAKDHSQFQKNMVKLNRHKMFRLFNKTQMNNCSLIEPNLNNLHNHVALNEVMSLKFGSNGAFLQKKSCFLIIKTKNSVLKLMITQVIWKLRHGNYIDFGNFIHLQQVV